MVRRPQENTVRRRRSITIGCAGTATECSPGSWWAGLLSVPTARRPGSMPPVSRRIARHPACVPERGAGGRSGAVRGSENDPRDRFPGNGRHDHQTARGRRYEGAADQVLHLRRAGQRLHRRSGAGSGSLPEAEWLLTDRGCDADWLREVQTGKGIKMCIPGRKSARGL